MNLSWQTDSALQLTAISPELRRALHLNPQRAHDVSAIAGPDRPGAFGAVAHEWALKGERVRFAVTWNKTEYALVVEPVHAVDGTITGVSGRAEPLADKIVQERRTAMIARAETVCGTGTWYFDAKSGEYEWSNGLRELLGTNCWMPFAHDVRLYDAPEDAKLVQQIVEHAELSHQPYTVDHRIVRVDGALRFVQERAEFFFDEDGCLSHVIGTMLDITDRKAGESRLTYLAYHDPLSDLPNRTYLEQRFAFSLERAHRSEAYCGLLFIDIDGFKNVNDTYGHRAGDDLLRAIAARLRRHVRSEDTLARLGGDEFVVLLDSLAAPEDADAAAATILEVFADPFMLGHHRIRVNASIGVAVAPPDGTTLEAILNASDNAMYRAKRSGGNAINAEPLRAAV